MFFFFWLLSRLFSVSFVFCSLNTICLGKVIGHLSFLVFSELPGSMVWSLTLIWENSSSSLLQILLILFLSSILVFPLCICHIFCSCPWTFFLFSLNLFSLCFSVLEVSTDISSSSEIFFPKPCPVYTNKPTKSILHFCYTVF